MRADVSRQDCDISSALSFAQAAKKLFQYPLLVISGKEAVDSDSSSDLSFYVDFGHTVLHPIKSDLESQIFLTPSAQSRLPRKSGH